MIRALRFVKTSATHSPYNQVRLIPLLGLSSRSIPTHAFSVTLQGGQNG